MEESSKNETPTREEFLEQIQKVIQHVLDEPSPEEKKRDLFCTYYGAMTDQQLEALPHGTYDMGCGMYTGKGGVINFVKAWRETMGQGQSGTDTAPVV